MKQFSEYFKNLRENANLTQEELASKLKVKPEIIKLLEEGKSINIILAKKILTQANEILNSPEDLLHLYLSNFQDEFPKNRFERSLTLNLNILIIILLIVFIIYFGWAFNRYLRPPTTTLMPDDVFVNNPYYEFNFLVEPKDSIVYINGIKIFPQENGLVKKGVYLEKGINKFKIKIVNKFERSIEFEKNIIYQPLEGITP